MDVVEHRHPLSGPGVAYLLQLAVFAVPVLFGLAAYAFSENAFFLVYGELWGLPWSIALWTVEPQTLSTFGEHALIAGSAMLNIVLLAALLWFAWMKTERGAYTASRNGTWKVSALAAGSLLLVALGSMGVWYSGDLAVVPILFGHPFLFGCAAALMLPSAMYYLLPWPWVAHSLLAIGVCVATVWAIVGMVVVSMEHTRF